MNETKMTLVKKLEKIDYKTTVITHRKKITIICEKEIPRTNCVFEIHYGKIRLICCLWKKGSSKIKYFDGNEHKNKYEFINAEKEKKKIEEILKNHCQNEKGELKLI